jgi:two-component system sensor histidine kinase RegB
MPVALLQIAPDNQRRVLVLRLSALIATTAMTLLAEPLFQILPPFTVLLAICGVWAAFSAVIWMWRSHEIGERGLFLQLGCDISFLTLWLIFCGGTANPLTALYLLPVATAGMLLRPILAWAAVLLTVIAYSLLWVVAVPITVIDVEQAMQMHLAGMWLTFTLSAVLLVSIIARISHALRDRERRLAAARERILRDERIVALGSLASGAAHALGTPLNTLTLLADEIFSAAGNSATLREDALELRAQVERCHETVRTLLTDAGIGEEGPLALNIWLDCIISDFRQRRPEATPRLEISTPASRLQIVRDGSLAQAINNLLENAADTCSDGITLTADLVGIHIVIRVTDHGPGFSATALQHIGHEPWSDKDTGMGIGLFLAAAVTERLGGRLQFCNTGTGAEARLELPADALVKS